jgi:hypothetical protein
MEILTFALFRLHISKLSSITTKSLVITLDYLNFNIRHLRWYIYAILTLQLIVDKDISKSAQLRCFDGHSILSRKFLIEYLKKFWNTHYVRNVYEPLMNDPN